MKPIILDKLPDAGIAAIWNASLADMPFATSYVSPGYFADTYISGDRFAILADNDGRIDAVLTGIRQKDSLVCGLFSRPQMVFRDRGDHSAASAALIDGLESLRGGHGFLTDVYSWDDLPVFGERKLQANKSNDETSVVVIDLSQGPDAIFAGFSQTRRNEVRKAIKQDVVEIGEIETTGELEELYQIYRGWNERKGNASDPIEKMQAAAEQRDNRRIFIAKTEGKVIAGSFYRYCRGGMAEYAANFSQPEYQRLRPNDLIGWHALQWACGSGCKLFSMGGSHLFLRRFGGDIRTTYQYRRDDRPVSLSGIKENAREMGSTAFRRLPANVQAGVRRVFTR